MTADLLNTEIDFVSCSAAVTTTEAPVTVIQGNPITTEAPIAATIEFVVSALSGSACFELFDRDTSLGMLAVVTPSEPSRLIGWLKRLVGEQRSRAVLARMNTQLPVGVHVLKVIASGRATLHPEMFLRVLGRVPMGDTE